MYDRRDGYLKTLKSAILPKRLLFFDTETWVNTDNNGNTTFPLRLGIALYVELNDELQIKKRTQYRFTTEFEFIEILREIERSKVNIKVFAHNIGFDVRVLNLPKVFNAIGWSNEPPIINDRVFIWDVYGEKGSFMFLDTSNYGVSSVDELGASLGFPKMDVDFNNVSNEDLYTYCLRDVEILEKFILHFIDYLDTNELGSFKSTLASQSLSVFRSKFLTNPPYIHTDEKALQLERDSYHGGRVECYHIGQMTQDTYYYLDVNSMYPFAMSSNELPQRLVSYRENIPVQYLKNWTNKHYCIADVDIETDINAFGLYTNHKFIFPVGRFRTQLHHHELLYALEHATILKVHRVAAYQMNSIFDRYVQFFYGEKVRYTQEKNLPYRTIAKLFQNSLYGKFGQLKPHRDLISSVDSDEVWRLTCCNLDTMDTYQQLFWYGCLYNEYKKGETLTSFPGLAGAITAIARKRLFDFMVLAGSDNVFYMDTDSLIVNQSGYDNLKQWIDEYKLGYLKLEETSDKLHIYGNKDYEFGDNVKTKGVPKKAYQVDSDRWVYMQFEGFISWLNKGANTTPQAVYLEKRRKSVYNKGVILDNGQVVPIKIDVL